jgi:acetylornithine/N-succinyldiaminopimelate aminotransferase
LKHPLIKNINSLGLMIAVEFENFETNKKTIDALIGQGIFTDWFLFAPHALRIVPPLNISEEEIKTACKKILDVLHTIA